MRLNGLGRGLESLIPRTLPESQKRISKTKSGDTAIHKENIFLVEIEKVGKNPLQPRRDFNEEELKSLADSIREHGILQPLVVTKTENESSSGIKVSYELIAGERRLKAAKMAGLDFVPVIIKKGAEAKEKLELALVENVQRSNLNPMEKARSFERLMSEFGLSYQDVSEKIGQSRELVMNTVRLLQLPIEIKKAVEAGKISEGHARTVLSVAPEKRIAMYNEILERNLSVRGAEALSRQIKGSTKIIRSNAVDPEFKAWEARLEDFFGTRVKLAKTGNRGRLLIEFYSPEELKSILGKIIKS